MHSEPTQNPELRPAHSKPRPAQLARPSTWPTNPRCELTATHPNQPHLNPTKMHVHQSQDRKTQDHAQNYPAEQPTEEGAPTAPVRQSATRGVRGVVPPDKHCEPSAKLGLKGQRS